MNADRYIELLQKSDLSRKEMKKNVSDTVRALKGHCLSLEQFLGAAVDYEKVRGRLLQRAKVYETDRGLEAFIEPPSIDSYAIQGWEVDIRALDQELRACEQQVRAFSKALKKL